MLGYREERGISNDYSDGDVPPVQDEWWRRPQVVVVGVFAAVCFMILGAVAAVTLTDRSSDDAASPLDTKSTEVSVADGPTTTLPGKTTSTTPATASTTLLPMMERVLLPGEVLGQPFETPMATSMVGLGQLIGSPDSEQPTTIGGGTGYQVSFGSLDIFFFEADFSKRNYVLRNWVVDEPSDWLTDRGIGVGDSVDKLLAAYPELTRLDPEGGCTEVTVFHGEDIEFVMDRSGATVDDMGSPFGYFC